MYLQREYLRTVATMTLGQTYRIDLPKSGMLSSLLIRVNANCTSGASLGGGAWRLLDFLGKLEIIGNGAQIIKSLDVKHLHFLSWLHQGIVPPHFWRNYADNTQYEYFLVNFGRYAGDPDFGLDLGRYDSVELRLANSGSATYYSTDMSISILQTFVRDAPGTFKGYLRSEEWRKWTTVQNETQYLLLPTEYPISLLAVQSVPHATNGMFDTNPQNLMYNLDLSKQGGTLGIYQGGMDALFVQNYMERGAEIITGGQADLTADKGIDVGVGRMFNWNSGASSKDGGVDAVVPTMIADATDGTISFEAREVDAPIQFLARGMGYMDFAWLWNNLDLEAGMFLDPKTDGECRLNVTTRDAATAAAGTNTVVLERLVS